MVKQNFLYDQLLLLDFLKKILDLAPSNTYT